MKKTQKTNRMTNLLLGLTLSLTGLAACGTDGNPGPNPGRVRIRAPG